MLSGMRGPFRRKPETAGEAPPDRHWIADAYGPRAEAVLASLPGLMAEATTEASVPRTRPSAEADAAAPVATARTRLADALLELRTMVLSTDVGEADSTRDARLRSAVSHAVGAARGLALASASQPTSGDLAQAQAGIQAILSAAGRGE